MGIINKSYWESERAAFSLARSKREYLRVEQDRDVLRRAAFGMACGSGIIASLRTEVSNLKRGLGFLVEENSRLKDERRAVALNSEPPSVDGDRLNGLAELLAGLDEHSSNQLLSVLESERCSSQLLIEILGSERGVALISSMSYCGLVIAEHDFILPTPWGKKALRVVEDVIMRHASSMNSQC